MSDRIFVIEDSPTQAAALREVLEGAGFETLHAGTGEEALDMLGSEHFDLVLSDIVMPGKVDGYEVCRRVKEIDKSKPVVLLTSLTDPMDIIRGLECGADNFLTKPYESRELIERLNLLLQLRRTRQAERFNVGVKILFMGREFMVTANREQILDMLLTTFEEAVKQNQQLRAREEELSAAKSELAQYAKSLEARLERLANSIPDVLYSMDPDGSVRYASRAASAVLGLRPEDLTLESWLAAIHPDDRHRVETTMKEVLAAGASRVVEYRYRRDGGSTRWIQQSVIPIRNGDGRPSRLDGIARDVTERHEADERLRRSEERYRSLVTATAQIVWTMDADGNVAEPLSTWQAFTGQSFEEVRGTGWSEAVHPDDRARVLGVWVDAVERRGRYDVTYRIRRHDGVYRLFSVRGVPVLEDDGSIREWVGTCTDVTEKQAAEDDLRRSEERLSTVFDANPVGIIVSTHADGRILQVNPALTELLGYGQSELVARTSREIGLVDEEERQTLILASASRQVGAPPVRVQMRHKSGEARTVYLSVRVIELDGQRCLLWLLQDATALERAQEAIVRQSEYLQILQLVTATVAASDDFDEALRFALEKLCRRTEWQAGRVYRTDARSRTIAPTDIWYPAGDARFENLRVITAETPVPAGKGLVGAVYAGRKAQWLEDVRDSSLLPEAELVGDLKVESAAAAPVVVGDEVLAVIELFSTAHRPTDHTFLDIFTQIGTQLGRVAERLRAREEKEKIEEQVRQAQKMEAVGRLAGGVAHDFNNILTVILSESDFAKQLEGAELAASLKEIHDAGERAAALTRQLLTFSRRDITKPEPLDPRAVVDGLRGMLSRLLGEHIRLHIRTDKESGWVKADRGQLEQVIVNLVVNARDAMPEGGGEIGIEVEDVQLDPEHLPTRKDLEVGDYVRIAVTDTGSGIPPEIRDRLFEPFFTTKEKGRGTGLGLSTSYGIVKEAGGHIGVYSEVGTGTAMKVYLPRIEPSGEASQSKNGEEAVTGGDELILLVEDDPSLRRIGRRLLKQLGYSVLEADGAPKALELLEQRGSEIALLFTDVVLPGASGREIAERGKELLPGLKVLYTTGYTDDVFLRHQLLDEAVSVLSKPYTARALAVKVRAALDSKSAT